MAIDDQIIEQLRSPSPPQTVEALAERLKVTISTLYPRISRLIHSGAIRSAECPWRAKTARPPKTADEIEARLGQWMDDGGKDRVSAAMQLYSILREKGATADPLTPNDEASAIKAIARILTAAGHSIAARGRNTAFPEALVNVPETPPNDQFATSNSNLA